MLTEEETNQLAALLGKLEWPVDQKVFHALMGATVSVPIELGVFNAEKKILMIYRDDPEFTGWHLPGTVMRDSDTVDTAIKRLGRGEVETYITTPIPLGWIESGRDIHPSRHEVALLHLAFLRAPYPGRGQFFDPQSLPEDTLTHHKMIVATMLERALVAGIDLGG